MSEYRSRDDRDSRSGPRRRSRSPPRPFGPSRGDSYRGDYYSEYKRRNSGYERDGQHSPNVAGSSPLTRRPSVTDPPSEYRSRDPRRLKRIETDLPSTGRLNGNASAGVVDSPRDTLKSSSSNRNNTIIAPQALRAMDPRRAPPVNDSLGGADPFGTLFSQCFNTITSALPLMMQREEARQKFDREARELQKIGLGVAYPATKEQHDEGKERSSKSLDQIDVKLKHQSELRDQFAKELGVHVSSMLPPPVLSRSKSFGDIAKSAENNSVKKVEANISAIKNDLKDTNERVDRVFDKSNTTRQLAERAERGSSEVRSIQDQNTQLQGQQTQLIADVFQLQTGLKADVSQLQAQLKADVSQLQTQLKTDVSHLQAQHAQLETNASQLQTKMGTQEQLLGQSNENIREIFTSLASVRKENVAMESDIRLKLGLERKEREKAEEQASETLAGLETAMARTRHDLDEMRIELTKSNHERRLQASRSQSRAPEEGHLPRLAKLEAAVESIKEQVQKDITYRLKKEEDMLDEVDKLNTRHGELEVHILQAQADIRQTQADVFQTSTRLNKTTRRLEHEEPAAASANSSKNASPHPQTPKPDASAAAITELQTNVRNLSNSVVNIQRQINQYTQNVQTMAAHTHAIQALESRYNNLTTEPLVKAMVQNMQEMYPYASNTQHEIEALKAELPQLAQLSKDQTSKLEGAVSDLTRRLDQEEKRLTTEEGNGLENRLKWEEERQDLLQRLEELKIAIEDLQNVPAEKVAEFDVKIDGLLRHCRLDKYADTQASEPVQNLHHTAPGTIDTEDVDDPMQLVNGHSRDARNRSKSNRGKELFTQMVDPVTIEQRNNEQQRKKAKTKVPDLETRITRPSTSESMASPPIPKVPKLTGNMLNKRKRTHD